MARHWRALRYILIVVPGLILMGCDSGDEDNVSWLDAFFGPGYQSPFDVRGEMDGPPLPDAAIDWQEHARAVRDTGDCAAYAWVVFRANDWPNTDVDPYLEDVRDGDICAGGEFADLRRAAGQFQFPRTLNSQTLYLLLMSDYAEGTISTARTLFDDEDEARDWREVLPDTFFEQEARWVRRCERPMYYAGAEFYYMRRALAAATDDPSFLMREWEERRTECAVIGAALLATLAPAMADLETAALARDLHRSFQQEVDWLTGEM